MFGWVRLIIEINHINIEPQVQIKAKCIIQFDNQHEFRIENGCRLISIFRYLFAPFLVRCLLQYPLPGLVCHVCQGVYK